MELKVRVPKTHTIPIDVLDAGFSGSTKIEHLMRTMPVIRKPCIHICQFAFSTFLWVSLTDEVVGVANNICFLARFECPVFVPPNTQIFSQDLLPGLGSFCLAGIRIRKWRNEPLWQRAAVKELPHQPRFVLVGMRPAMVLWYAKDWAFHNCEAIQPFVAFDEADEILEILEVERTSFRERPVKYADVFVEPLVAKVCGRVLFWRFKWGHAC